MAQILTDFKDFLLSSRILALDQTPPRPIAVALGNVSFALDGGITPRLKGRLPWPETDLLGSQQSLFSRTVEEAFFMSITTSCHHRGRARRWPSSAGTATRPPCWAPTWSSCAWIWSADPDVAAALAGRTHARHRDLPPRVGRGGVQGLGGRAAGDSASARCQQGAEYVDVEFKARVRRADPLRAAASASCCRCTTSRACRAILPTRVRAMRAAGAEIVKVAVHGAVVVRQPALLELRDARSEDVLIGMGPSGLPTRLLAGAFRIAVDVRR